MASLVDACIFIAASAGTGSFVVSAPKPGWRTPATAGAVNGDTYRYRAYSADQTQWEVGTGVYTSGTTTLTRAVITDSSNAGAAVNFSAAPSVALTVFSGDLATPAQLAKVDFLTVTASTNLDTIRTTVAALGTASTKNTGTSAGQVPLLDGSGLLDTSILPAIAITDVNVVASQAAMLALTAQKGDIAIRSDLNKTFGLSTNSPTTLADWKELLTPTDAVLSVAGLTGAISAAGLKTALAIAVADITDASANGRSFISAANYAAMKVLLTLSQADISGMTTADSPQFAGVNLGNASDTTLSRSAAGILAVEGENIYSTKLVALFTALHNQPPATNYATLDTRNSHPVLDFDTTTQEAAIFGASLPSNYKGNGLTVKIIAALTSATTGTLGWEASFERDDTGLDIDADSFATGKIATAATVPATSGQTMVHTLSFSNSEIDGLQAGEPFRLRIRRDVANDTAAGDAELLRATVEMT